MTGFAATLPSMARAVPRPPLALRRLRLVNCHTGETFDGSYRNDQGPIPRVIDELCVFLRDHHSGEKTQIDVAVIDFLADVMDSVGKNVSAKIAKDKVWNPEIEKEVRAMLDEFKKAHRYSEEKPSAGAAGSSTDGPRPATPPAKPQTKTPAAAKA